MVSSNRSTREMPDDAGSFRCVKSALRKRSARWREEREPADGQAVLLAVVEGRGRIRIRGEAYDAAPGDAFVFASRARIEAVQDRGAPLFRYYELTIGSAGREGGVGGADGEAGCPALPPEGRLQAEPFARLLDCLQRLHAAAASAESAAEEAAEADGDGEGAEAFRELLRLVAKACGGRAEAGVSRTLQAVADTVAKLRLAYREDWTVERLAGLANIGVWQYRQLFKQLTGQTPNAFIAELRVADAKERLLLSGDSIGDIARGVGYEDEYYFSRRFRQLAGQSPRHYVQSTRAQMKVAAFTHFGDLLSLGSRPLAANDSLLHWLRDRYTNGVAAIETSAAGLDRLDAMRPDLILVNGYTEPIFADELRHIAPTVQLHSHLSMFDNLAQLAELMGKRAEMKAWLARYRSKAGQVRAQVGRTIGGAESAIRFHIVDRAVYVYRTEESPVLYEVLGFAAPDRLRELVAARASSRLFVGEETFADYEADRIFVTVGTMAGARQTYERIVGSARWQSLEAVRQGRVYEMEEAWSLDGTIALEWQLDGIAELLLRGGDMSGNAVASAKNSTIGYSQDGRANLY